MSIVAYDVSAAGSLANASLCAPPPKEGPATREASSCSAAPARGPAPAPQTAARAKWRRVIDGLVALVSGPTLEQARRAASRV